MKSFFLGTVATFCSLITCSAQTGGESIATPVRNVSLELLGGSNGIGIQYDTRLKGNSGWGYGVGAGWGYSKASMSMFDYMESYHNVSVAPRINYLLGRKNSKLELGFGVNLGYQFGKEEYDKYNVIPQEDGTLGLQFEKHVKENRSMFTYFFFGNIGYRRQASHGFVFRVGVAPVFGFGGKHTVDKFYFVPYLGFGKSF